MKFLELPYNASFVYAMAQRRKTYNSWELATNKSEGQLSKMLQMENKKIKHSSRSVPVNIKPNGLVEIRMFASTLNQESFMKNLEFVDAFWNWSKETSFNTTYQAFLKWLCSTSQHFTIYHNLLNYLTEDKFGCKQGPPVHNEWKDTIVLRPYGQLTLFDLTPNVYQSDLEDRNDVL
jgi:hypothetical protein